MLIKEKPFNMLIVQQFRHSITYCLVYRPLFPTYTKEIAVFLL